VFSIKNNIDFLLSNLNKSRYWLAKEVGITYPSILKLANNETTSINFELMENLCLTLECSLDELFTIERNKKADEY